MGLNITQVADGAALATDEFDGRPVVIRPTGQYPWWEDETGKPYHPNNFTWELQ